MRRFKRCNGVLCKGAVLPIDAFSMHSNGKAMAWCKTCAAATERERYRKKRASILAHKRKFRRVHRDRLCAKARECYRRNRARLLALRAKHRESNREYLRARDAQYREKNRPRINAQKRIQNKRRKIVRVLLQHGIGG